MQLTRDFHILGFGFVAEFFFFLWGAGDEKKREDCWVSCSFVVNDSGVVVFEIL